MTRITAEHVAVFGLGLWVLFAQLTISISANALSSKNGNFLRNQNV